MSYMKQLRRKGSYGNSRKLQKLQISQNKILRMTIYSCLLNSCEICKLFSRAPISNCLGVIGESLFTLFASLTFVYHYLMTLII